MNQWRHALTTAPADPIAVERAGTDTTTEEVRARETFPRPRGAPTLTSSNHRPPRWYPASAAHDISHSLAQMTTSFLNIGKALQQRILDIVSTHPPSPGVPARLLDTRGLTPPALHAAGL